MFIDVQGDVIDIKEEVAEIEITNFYVDVKGAVRNPGVYEFITGDKVIDAIEKAGGLIRSANTSNINLSKKLDEEMVVYVFTNNEIKRASTVINCDTACAVETITIDNCVPGQSGSAGSNSPQSGKVNINRATLSELMTLPGIGEAKARTIIEFRTNNGPFEKIEDITKVSGIGQATFESLKDLITV